MKMNRVWEWVLWACMMAFLGCGVVQCSVTYDRKAMVINGQRRILISGSIHYPRSTPEMWGDLINKAKEGGLDVIDTYVFWNVHEPSPGNYNFEGRYDLVRFVKTAQKAGLYVHLRLGPYVCAEWNFGGFPVWLKYVPGISFRTDNEPFKMAMKGFAEKIVNLLKSENLYKTQGGPIILSQIENEYGPQAKMLGTPGLQYAAWAANMAVALDTGVPWVMCKEEDAPDPVINTCNGFYCDVFSPNKPYKPAMWTEAWSGWFSEFGGSTHERSVQDLAFGVARNYEGKFTDTIEKLGVNSDDGKAYIKACGAIGNDSFKEETIFNRLFPLIKVVFLYTSQGHIAVVLSSNIRVLGTRLFKKESAVTTRLKDGRELNGPRDNIGIG